MRQQLEFNYYLQQYNLVKYKIQNGQLSTNLSKDVSLNDVQTISDLLDSINQIYTAYYNLVPSTDELIQEQQLNSSSEGKKKQDIWDKTLNALKFYQKVRNFTVLIINKREELIQNIIFLSDKVDRLKTTEDDMLRFYALNDRYYQVKLASANYEYKDQKFILYYSEIHDLNEEFNEDVNNFAREIYNLMKFHDFFEAAIDQLYNLSKIGNVIQVLQAIDSLLMLTLRILEFKLSNEVAITNAKKLLTNIKDYRIKILGIMSKIEDLTAYYVNGLDQVKKVEQPVKLKAGILSVFLWVLLWISN